MAAPATLVSPVAALSSLPAISGVGQVCVSQRRTLGFRSSAAYGGQRRAAITVSSGTGSSNDISRASCISLRCSIQPVESSAQKGFVGLTRDFFRVLESVAPVVVQMGGALRDAVQKPNTEEEVQLLTALKGRMVCAAAPLFFAAISQSVNTPLTVVASGMAKWLELYSGVLMVRVLLSWFPNIPWERQPLQAMRDMCDPYLNLFRNIIPPLFNALDLSPMLAFLVLGVLTSILNTTVQAS